VREFRYRNKGFFEILKENAARIDDQAVRAAVNR
jgi:hypothetical protein